MSSLYLIRHGDVAINANQTLTGHAFGSWIDDYNHAPLNSTPPQELIEQLPDSIRSGNSDQSIWVVCSQLRRSQDSATALQLHPNICDIRFQESELPYFRTALKLPVKAWLVITRVAWWLGYHAKEKSHQTESFRQSQTRILHAVQQLEDWSQQHEHIVLVGHGLFLRSLVKQLKAKGWQGEKAPRHNWECQVFVKASDVKPIDVNDR